MEILTERLLIRKVVADDWISLKRIWDDFRLSEYAKYDVPHKSDADEIKSQVSRWENANQGEKHLFFAVCLETEVIGYIDFHESAMAMRADTVSIQITTGKDMQKKVIRLLSNFFRIEVSKGLPQEPH